MIQLDLLDLLLPPPPAPAIYVRREPRTFQTRAALHGGVVTVFGDEDFDPFEIEVRGMVAVLSWSGGLCTNVVDPIGSRHWSETGFFSTQVKSTRPDDVRAYIENHIDTPRDKYGLGGKPSQWWPSYVLQWRDDVAFHTQHCQDRSVMWDQWGPDRHAECWAKFDARQADAIARMIGAGIDPNDIEPPWHFKGKWPRIDKTDIVDRVLFERGVA